MNRVRYKLNKELYDEVEQTSEGLLIEWYDDCDDSTKLRIENRIKNNGKEYDINDTE
jgi:hypothetical protein